MPLGAYIRGFPAPARLHPFERALLELTVGAGTYERVLARVDALRRSTVEVRSQGAGWLEKGMRWARAAANLQRSAMVRCAAHLAAAAQCNLPMVAAASPARPTLCRWARRTPHAPRVRPARRTRWRCRRRGCSACRRCSAAAATQVRGGAAVWAWLQRVPI